MLVDLTHLEKYARKSKVDHETPRYIVVTILKRYLSCHHLVRSWRGRALCFLVSALLFLRPSTLKVQRIGVDLPRHQIVIFSAADERLGCPITETKRIGHLGSMKPFSVSVSQDP